MANRIHIRGAQLVTMDATLGDFPAADILIEDGAILAVGPSLDGGGAETIDGAGMIALPGIIDAHTCLWQTVLRGYVPDLWPGAYYSKFLPLRSRFTAEDNFNAAWIGGFEMLSYGTTTVVDYCHDIRSPAFAPASLAALKETGIRHLFTYSFMPPTPDEFARPEDRLADGRRVYDEFHDPKSLTTIGFGVEFDRRTGPGGAARLRARSQGAKLHPRQRDRHHRQARRPGPARARPAGDPRQPDQQSRARAHGRRRHAALLHAHGRHPGHAGRCRAPRRRARRRRGVRLRHSLHRGVGHAGRSCASCSTCRAISTAPWNAASRPCWAAGRRCGPACRCSTPRRLIETATITAARVLGLGDRIGSLTPGKRADIVLVRKGPFGDSVVDDACAHVLLQTSPRDIDTVLVDGKVRMKAGVLQGFDARRAAAMTADSRKRILG